MKKPPPASKPPASKPPASPAAGNTPARYTYGPRVIGALMPAITRPAFKKQSPASASLMLDWPTLVGPALARATQPRRLAAGTLTLACRGPVALELQHLAGPLIERINAHLGQPLVQRLRFLQDAAAIPAPPPAPRPRLDPVPIPGMPEGELRDALAALGAWLRPDRA